MVQASLGLHVVDYVVFGGMLVLSLAIGIYYGFTGGKQKTNEEFLLGNRQMRVIPVTLSFTVSFISTILILGIPAEIYTFGAGIIQTGIGTVCGILMAAFVFVPVLYPLRYTSVNEYLENRFHSKIVRAVGSFCTIFGAVFYAASVYYGPSTAIEAVSGVPAWITVLISCVVSIIYTTLGGFKAVVWTDVFQSVIMVLGMLAIVIRGFMLVGVSEAFHVNKEWGRMRAFDFDFDLTKRMTFWGSMIGRSSTFLYLCGSGQASFQRYSSMRNIRQAYQVVMLSAVGCTFLFTLAVFTGWVVFAYYAALECDPLRADYIDNPNQLVPYFVMEVFRVPGLPGLFLAAASAASLSSASSALNAAAANAWEDILKPLLPASTSPQRATLFTKGLVVVFGAIATGFAFAIIGAGGTVVQVTHTFASAFDCPVLAIYICGLFLPWVTWKGLSVGSVFGFAFALWVGIGSYSINKHLDVLPATTEGCNVSDVILANVTSWAPDILTSGGDSQAGSLVSTLLPTADIVIVAESSPLHRLYSVSFLWIMPICVLMVILISLVASFILGARKSSDVEARFMHPIARYVYKLKYTDHSQATKEELQELKDISA